MNRAPNKISKILKDAGMEFRFLTSEELINKPILQIYSGFDMSAIYLAYVSLRDNYNIYVERLEINNLGITEIPEDYLENMNSLLVLSCCHNELQKIPKLPNSLISIDISFNKIDNIEQYVKDNLSNIECFYYQPKKYEVILLK